MPAFLCDGIQLALAATYEELDGPAARARAFGTTTVDGPFDTPWNTRDVTLTRPEGLRVVLTTRRSEPPAERGVLRRHAATVTRAGAGLEEAEPTPPSQPAEPTRRANPPRPIELRENAPSDAGWGVLPHVDAGCIPLMHPPVHRTADAGLRMPLARRRRPDARPSASIRQRRVRSACLRTPRAHRRVPPPARGR